MAVEFPEQWKDLRWPDQRDELLGNLEELSSREYQIAAWINRTRDAHLVVGIDEIFHFFFDDTDLARDPKSTIGYILFDEREALALQPITDTLDAMLSELGDADSRAFVNAPQWEQVIQAAKNALDIVAARGRPVLRPS